MSDGLEIRTGRVVGPGGEDIVWDEEGVCADDVAWFWSQVAQAVLMKAIWRVQVAINQGWPRREDRA